MQRVWLGSEMTYPPKLGALSTEIDEQPLIGLRNLARRIGGKYDIVLHLVKDGARGLNARIVSLQAIPKQRQG